MSAHIGTCRHISAHVSMSTCADICQHADKIQLIGIIWAKNDVTCRHMSAHVGTYQHMLACPYVLTHGSVEIRPKWFVSEMPRVMLHVGTCRHMSACPHVLTHSSMQTRSKWLVSEVPREMLVLYVDTYRHMSAHIGTCRHISAHVSMSTCADICQHADKIQIIGIIGAENDVTCRHMSAHASTCRHVHKC